MDALAQLFGASPLAGMPLSFLRALKFFASDQPAAAFLGSVVVFGVVIALCSASQSRSKRGFGSGENDSWNRRIRTERPVHRRKHYKLEKQWIYTGAGTHANMVAAQQGLGAAVSATDATTGLPLTGHLIGRQTWQAAPAPPAGKGAAATSAAAQQDAFTFNPSVNVNASDKLMRSQLLAAHGRDPLLANVGPPRGAPSVSVDESLRLGWDFFAALQCDDGHWAGDYGGPMFLMPGLVITCAIAGYDLGDRKSAMLTYLMNHQQEDGGWGLHIEGPSTVFGTSLSYVTARILGLPASHEVCVAARRFLHAHGGAVTNPHWGKFWLAALGVYEWEGVNPVPPELWMLPRWFPFHPGKMWCHCRMVYLPMSYVYGVSGVGTSPALAPLQAALKQELYVTPYESIAWDAQRNNCAEIDLYAPHTFLMESAFWVFRAFENWTPTFIRDLVRRPGLRFALEYLEAEDFQTNYVDIGPVNKAVNMLAIFFAHGADSPQFRRHLARLDDYLWVAEDGMKMQGYNGSQLWDTAFAAQSLAAAGPSHVARHAEVLARAYSYIDASQSKEDVPSRTRYFRTVSKGGWPFSTNDHGWPIADCTSEGMLAALAIEASGVALGPAGAAATGFGALRSGVISPQRYFDAVNVLKEFHNPDGGWATYEETRGGPWYESLNPAEVFGDIMIDYTYTELTSTCVSALAAFRARFPNHEPATISRLIAAGTDYVRAQQRDDGSWYGSWAVCFTYGAWFGVETLVIGGDPTGADAAALSGACSFLLSKQRADGGWGESYLSCLTKRYCQAPSNAVNTAWALMALMRAGCKDAHAVRRGIDFIISSQTAEGDWEQAQIAGIFNRVCAIQYSSYRNVFPLWALGLYATEFKHALSAPVSAPA